MQSASAFCLSLYCGGVEFGYLVDTIYILEMLQLNFDYHLDTD